MKRARLSISSFKHISKIALDIGVFLVCLIVGEKIWEYCVYDDTMEEARAVMYDFYHQESIDNLFLGSSHVYFDVNPELMNEYTGENNYNLSTPLQPLMASYYLLKEANKRYDIRNVCLEMYYGVSVRNSSILSNWRVYDYMPFSANRVEYILAAGNAENRYLSFFRARRMWQNALDPDIVMEIIKKKQGDEYKSHKWVKRNEHGVEYFEPGGFLYTEYQIDEESCKMAEETSVISENPMSAEAESYLRKILEYCKDNDINIVLFCAPMTAYKLSENVGHDNYYRQVNRIAGEYGVEYFDFNLSRAELLDLNSDHFWRDKEHLNVWGAEEFTGVAYKILLSQDNMEKREYFYDSYADKP